MCPFCGSLSRTRRLWSLVDQQNNLQGNILHFSPSRSLYRTIKKLNGIRYFSSDFEDEFLADYQFDITNIDQPNAIFDVIICFHVLEHILDDNKAISELHRVLKPKGTVYIQTPFKEGDIYEDNSITTSDGRLAHFGQEDHVRIYSVNGLKKRLEDGGFHVQVNTFEISNEDAFYGLKSPESILVATKPTE